MSLRVALDVTTAVTQRAGVGRYTRELVQALAGLPDGPDLRLFYVAPEAPMPLAAGPPPIGVRRSIREWRLEIMVRQILGRPARGPWDGAHVYHAPDVVYPPLDRMPVVATVHDLSYIVYPRFHTRLNGSYLRLLTPIAARRAQLVIAVSEATKRDLMAFYRIPEHRVRVIHSGVAGVFTHPPADEHMAAVRRRYGLEEPFLLSVGTLEPRKNLHATLRGYRLLRERLPDAPLLALAGSSGWRLVERDLIDPRDSPRVRRLGYVPDGELATLYASCSAFVYPSLYEGWGFPVAEALALGAPTITSNVSSLPEVAGDAALLVDPRSPEAIAAALERVLVDDTTAARLRMAGPARARQFSSETWARATLQVYREAAEV